MPTILSSAGPLSIKSCTHSEKRCIESRNPARPTISKPIETFPSLGRRSFKAFIVVRKLFANFHARKPAPIVVTVVKMSSKCSLIQSTNGFNFFCHSSICSVTAPFRKSYSGRSMPRSSPKPVPKPLPLLSFGEKTFNSSKPATYCFSFLAAPAASSILSAISPEPTEAPSKALSQSGVCNSTPNKAATAAIISLRALATAIAMGKTFVRAGMNKSPTARAACSSCALRTRIMLVGCSKVRAISP